MRRRSRILVILALQALAMVSCIPPLQIGPTGSPDQPVSSDQPTLPVPAPTAEASQVEVGLAVVDSIDILMMESMPVQVNVVVRGNLPDGCTTIGQATTDRQDTFFVITLATQRPVDAMCTEALVPYEQTVPLDVAGLSSGVYTVTVNGVSETFELAIGIVPTLDS